MSADAINHSREKYSPFNQVYVTYEEDGDTERIYVGKIDGVSLLRTWEDSDGERHHARYKINQTVRTPFPMDLEEVLEWIESAPEEINCLLVNDLETDLGETIGVSEYYPSGDE